MTDLSRCRLLALPREIRDLIYAYLHQSALATEEPRGNESGNLLVLVTCAPLTAVLQLCKQIQSEYLEMVFNHIALRIAVPSDHKIMDGIKLKDGVPSKIFTRAVEILVNVDYVRIDDRLEEESGDELSVYLDGVVSEPEEASVQRQYKGDNSISDRDTRRGPRRSPLQKGTNSTVPHILGPQLLEEYR